MMVIREKVPKIYRLCSAEKSKPFEKIMTSFILGVKCPLETFATTFAPFVCLLNGGF